MVDILDSIPKIDSSDETHPSVEVQSLSKGFSHKDKKIRRKGATLSDTPGGLKSFTRSTINQRGNPRSRDARSDEANKGRLKTHLF